MDVESKGEEYPSVSAIVSCGKNEPMVRESCQ